MFRVLGFDCFFERMGLCLGVWGFGFRGLGSADPGGVLDGKRR